MKCMAHEDSILQILPGDLISGVPEEFGPVSLIIRDLGTDSPRVEFRSGGRGTTLLPCVSSLIASRIPSEVLVEGSWYHDKRFTPYDYLHVSFLDPG